MLAPGIFRPPTPVRLYRVTRDNCRARIECPAAREAPYNRILPYG
jgi:hypothetical protein